MTLLRDDQLAAAFDHAAHNYDLLVSVNPGYHSHLRRSARRLALPNAGAGLRVLDLGCGTGASTAALLRAAPQAEITAIDASAGMLEQARSKRWPPNVRFLHLPVEELAAAGVGNRFDAVFAAYLFRNVSDPDAILDSVLGLLTPGGRLAIHEYTLGASPLHRALWSAVCKTVILPTGTLTGDRELYRHLFDSVLAFDTVEAFSRRLRQAGYENVRAAPMPGWQTGIVHTVVARAPRPSAQGAQSPDGPSNRPGP
ncbi:class I SAM-dependent methyltransferase [Streptomyces sp. NPDC055749]